MNCLVQDSPVLYSRHRWRKDKLKKHTFFTANRLTCKLCHPNSVANCIQTSILYLPLVIWTRYTVSHKVSRLSPQTADWIMRGNNKKGGIIGAFAVPGCFGSLCVWVCSCRWCFFLGLTNTRTCFQAVHCKETHWLFPLCLQSSKRNHRTQTDSALLRNSLLY